MSTNLTKNDEPQKCIWERRRRSIIRDGSVWTIVGDITVRQILQVSLLCVGDITETDTAGQSALWRQYNCETDTGDQT